MWSYYKENQGHLNQHGSAPGEQNHASISSYMGKGGMLSLLQNAQQILKRDHQHKVEQRSKRNAPLVGSTDRYRSNQIGFLNRVDNDAKHFLSQYAYSMHCKIQKAYPYITRTETRNGIVDCYIAGTQLQQSIQWKVNSRCVLAFTFIQFPM